MSDDPNPSAAASNSVGLSPSVRTNVDAADSFAEIGNPSPVNWPWRTVDPVSNISPTSVPTNARIASLTVSASAIDAPMAAAVYSAIPTAWTLRTAVIAASPKTTPSVSPAVIIANNVSDNESRSTVFADTTAPDDSDNGSWSEREIPGSNDS